MKIVVPEFVLPTLESALCTLVQQCEVVTVDQEGDFSGDPAGAEVVMLGWGLPDATMERLLSLPTVRWIHSVSAGVEHALDESLRDHPAVLTNASGVFDIPIAETVLAYVLMVVKQMPQFLEQQRAHRWEKLKLREAQGLTVGIVGLGSIGTEVARRCRALGMHVAATRRHPDLGSEVADELLTPDRLPELLAASDFVVLTLPLTSETAGMIDAEALEQMRGDAWLINVSRGAIVEEEALLAALREGRIGGAALDVFEREPLPEDSPFWDAPNVIVTPHNSWSTPHMRRREAELFLDNLRRHLQGEPLHNVVDKALGY